MPHQPRNLLGAWRKTPANRFYRIAPLELAELHKQLKTCKSAEQIKPANSTFGAGLLSAKKNGGFIRMCIDYRALNKIIKKDSYQLPRIDEIWMIWLAQPFL